MIKEINKIVKTKKFIDEDNYYKLLCKYGEQEVNKYLKKHFEKVYFDEDDMITPFMTFKIGYIRKQKSNPSPLLEQDKIDELLKGA